MKSIEVKTTQNVILEYELADLRDRAIAFVIDFIILFVVCWTLLLSGFSGFDLQGTAAFIYVLFVAFIFLFYAPAMEMLNNGQSLGKMIMKIQVIKTEGGQAEFAEYTARWVFRLVDIYCSFGGIASILVASSAKAQRIGDIVANTAVIKLRPKLNLKLNDVLAIRSQDSYKPVYVQAKQLEEVDVLLIKTTIERYRQFKNLAHQEAVHMLAGKIKSLLAILPQGQQNDLQFLQTVLNDYVVLTR